MPAGPSLRMLVEDVFFIAGRGVVVTGSIESGSLHAGDEVVVRAVGAKGMKTKVTSIESFKKMINQANAGDQVGVLLAGLTRNDVARGFELVSLDLQVE